MTYRLEIMQGILRSNIVSFFWRWLVLAMLLSLVACSPSTTSTGQATEGEIVVAAAASLQFAFQELAEVYEQDTGQHVRLVFGSSGQLTQQIENGAPYDLFAAANQDYIDRLVGQGLALEDSVRVYARGRIVLAANRQAGLVIETLEDLLDPSIRHIAIANPEHAPYGLAAKQALQTAGMWEQVQDKLVLAENVRQALQFVQTGDAQAGIIALAEANVPEITWVLIDEALHVPLDQSLAVLAASDEPELAAQFSAYINGTVGRPIMRRYGFVLPGEPVVQSGPDPALFEQP
jgi:molybdate transport system substrate-binding protein